MRTNALARVAVAATVASIVAAGTAAAQEASGRGFLFGAPNAAFTLRVGYAGANAGSDVFRFVTDQLTLRRGDFGSFSVGGDLAVAVTPRVDIVISVDDAEMSKQSEFREWQDNSGNPIQQMTSFSRLTYAASVRYYVLPRGRDLGRFAWMPARFAPWVSVGIGRTMYDFTQNGDFVDFNAGNRVFPDQFKSSEWGTTGQLAGGVDWSFTPRFALTTQIKYLWGSGPFGGDYAGYGPIDLSGVGVTGGLSIRF